MKIREMELLIRVAEAGSMTRAAQQVHLTPAAVSAALQRIEEALGLRIFERTTRSLHPTEDGLVLLDGCRTVLAEWRRTLEDLRGDAADLQGTVRLSAPTDTTYQILDAMLVDFAARHPAVQVIVDASDTVQHLHQEAIDLAIRYGPLPDSGLTARRLAHCPIIVVAAPAYLNRHGAPTTPAEIAEHRCITIRVAGAIVDAWSLSRDGETTTVQLPNAPCVDGFLARRWAVAGLGLSHKSLFDVIDDLEAGRLVRVLPDYASGPSPITAVFPSRRFQPARVRLLADAIVERFAARAARCAAWWADHG